MSAIEKSVGKDMVQNRRGLSSSVHVSVSILNYTEALSEERTFGGAEFGFGSSEPARRFKESDWESFTTSSSIYAFRSR